VFIDADVVGRKFFVLLAAAQGCVRPEQPVDQLPFLVLSLSRAGQDND
jgi:hypothetical protein